MEGRRVTVPECRPCDMAAAVGLARVLCQEENLACEELERIFERGYESEEEVLQALRKLVEQMPEGRRSEAMTILCAAFPQEAGCENLREED